MRSPGRPLTIGMLLVLAGWCAAAAADDIANAIVNVDPRDRLESGTGAAYGSIFAPKSEIPEEPLNMTPYYSLRSSTDWLQSSRLNPFNLGLGDLNNQSPAAPRDESDAILGKPEARRGVYYEDDVTHR